MAEIKSYARPTSLFRYRPINDEVIERELDAIRSGYVYCSGFDHLNDPMEGSHRVSLLFRRATTDIQQQILERRNNIGISSFSETNNSEPMWAHYAGSFSGLCVEYRLKMLLSRLPSDCELVRMTYSEKPPILLDDEQTIEEKAKLTLSTKTLRWASEREWRLLRGERGKAIYGNPKQVVRAIYIGMRMREDHREKIRSAALNLGIDISYMSISKYEIMFSNTLEKRIFQYNKKITK